MDKLQKHLQTVLDAHKATESAYRISYFGETLNVHPGVFSPILTASTTTTVRSMRKRKDLWSGKLVVDMGCGTGALAIMASKLGAFHVLAADISSRAIKNTDENIRLTERQEIISTQQTDLFDNLSLKNEEIDIHLANLPLIDSEVEDEFEKAFFDTKLETVKRYLGQCSELTKKGGLLFLNSASVSDTPTLVTEAVANGFELDQVDVFEEYIFDHYVLIFRKI